MKDLKVPQHRAGLDVRDDPLMSNLYIGKEFVMPTKMKFMIEINLVSEKKINGKQFL